MSIGYEGVEVTDELLKGFEREKELEDAVEVTKMSIDQEEYPWYSEILPRLWQGGTPDAEMIDTSQDFSPADQLHGFTAVLTLDARSQPMGWSVKELRYGFADGAIERSEVPKLLELADWAYEHWQRGEKVLIRCQAGANRSGLIVALVLMKDGMSADDAIARIRSRRPMALSNSAFVGFLKSI